MGGNAHGASRLQVVTSTKSGVSRCSYDQRRSAGAAEIAAHFGRGFEFERRAAREAEFGLREGDPGDHRRCGRTPARLAVADHAVHRIGRGGIAHGAAHAAALNVVAQTSSPPSGRELTCHWAIASGSNLASAKKEPRLTRGSRCAETGVLFRSFRSVAPGRVPDTTNTLCHEGAFSPTPKNAFICMGCGPVPDRYQPSGRDLSVGAQGRAARAVPEPLDFAAPALAGHERWPGPPPRSACPAGTARSPSR